MKKNNKKNTYHFRRYRLSKFHPFLVVLVTEESNINGKILLSGFNLTRSASIARKKSNKFIQIKNPNPDDDLDCYLCTDIVLNKPISLFQAPIRKWKLSDKDKRIVDKLVEKKIKTPSGVKIRK